MLKCGITRRRYTSSEMLFCSGMEVAGVMFFGIFTGILSSIMLGRSGASQEYETQMDFIRSYLEHRGLRVATRRKVVAFYDNLWQGKAAPVAPAPPPLWCWC